MSDESQVITTRNYDDRLDTLTAVRDAGISVCSGGIIGLGEEDTDRVGLIWEMSQCVSSIIADLTRRLIHSARQITRGARIFPCQCPCAYPWNATRRQYSSWNY